MDEGVRVLGRGKGQAATKSKAGRKAARRRSSSFDDIDEHPGRKGAGPAQPQVQAVPGPGSMPATNCRQPLPASVSLPFKQMFGGPTVSMLPSYQATSAFGKERNSRFYERGGKIEPTKLGPAPTKVPGPPNQYQRVRSLSGNIINIQSDEVNQQYFKIADADSLNLEARSHNALPQNGIAKRRPSLGMGPSAGSQYPVLEGKPFSRMGGLGPGSESGHLALPGGGSVAKRPAGGKTKSSRSRQPGDERDQGLLARTGSAHIYYQGGFPR